MSDVADFGVVVSEELAFLPSQETIGKECVEYCVCVSDSAEPCIFLVLIRKLNVSVDDTVKNKTADGLREHRCKCRAEERAITKAPVYQFAFGIRR